jgi:hypothetical protein
LFRLPVLRHDQRMLVKPDRSHPRELSDAEMRQRVATVRQGVVTGALLAESSGRDELVQHLEEERRRLNR